MGNFGSIPVSGSGSQYHPQLQRTQSIPSGKFSTPSSSRLPKSGKTLGPSGSSITIPSSSKQLEALDLAISQRSSQQMQTTQSEMPKLKLFSRLVDALDLAGDLGVLD